MVSRRPWGAVALAFLVAGFTGRAETEADLREENKQLRQRLENIETELGQIKKQLARPAETLVADPKKKPLLASVEMELYGYLKLDAAYDDSRANVGNFARWVESESTRPNDDQFAMTANQTRLGLNLAAPTVNGIKTTGKLEIDFYGAGTAENKPEVLLRHAYLNAEWLDYHCSVLAGQTADIISPLFLPTLNYSVGWWQGNIGYRRPQIRLTENLPIAPDWSAKLEGGVSRTITDRRLGATDPNSGDDAGWPTLQGRASLNFPTGGKRQGTIGISGHYGEEEQHLTAGGNCHHHTWSANVDVKLPLAKWLTLQGEAFVGANLDSFNGGIGYGVNTNTMQSIVSHGGWVAATIDPHPKLQFNIGAGLDHPHEEDLPNKARSYNSVAFINGSYLFTANFSVGLEVSYLRTCYKGQEAGDDWREQLAFIYKF